MKRMDLTVRIALVSLFFLLAAGFAGAQALQTFNKAVDFNATLKSLSTAAATNQPISTGNRLVVLNGVAETVENLSNNPKQFFAMIEMVDGQWHGLHSVSLYRCYILVQGPEFSHQVLLRPQPNAPADAIESQSQFLVVGDVKGVVAAPDGSKVPVVQAYYLRKLN